MTHRVTFTSKAKREFNEAAIWWAEHRSVEQAAQWLDGLESAILQLAEDPERHPLAREDEHFSFSLRQLLFGIGPKPTHRLLYRVRDDEVIIYGVRHVARRDVRPEDI
jgi:plasmid stabilization system protein ParE